jgi:hypothetical protein
MKDETFVFISDVKDKKTTARSARHQRTHTGKGGRVRLPSDNLSKKELQKMNGECKSYRLNEPMAWKEFKAMPDDIKVTYIKLLREKFDVPDCELYKMFGTDKDTLSRYFKKLNLRVPRKNVHREWKKDEWFAWVHGVEQLPTPVSEEMPDRLYSLEEAEAFIEEDIHIEEPDPIPVDSFTPVQIPVTAVPNNGSMNFTCPANQALNTLAQLLGETNVSISVMWRVIEEGKVTENVE